MPQNNTRSLVHTVGQLTLILVCAMLALAMWTATPAHAMQAPTCTTDLDCVALELDQAARTGDHIHEDLSWTGMSPLAAA